MTSETIHASFPDMTEEDYQDLVHQWLEIKDIDESEGYYQAEILPRSCYRMRMSATEEVADLLLVPVGTQPYAPLMCCLGLPARRTVLLMTEESRQYAEQVEGWLEGERAFQKCQISESDSGDIVRKVMATFDVLGQPKNVVCDVTGGTKIMTASLAGIAAMNGWRQTYVGSTQVRNKGSHSERIIPVASVFEHLGGWHLAHAWKLASLGHFGEASKLLKLAAAQSVASAQLRRDLRRFHLAHAYRTAAAEKVCAQVRQVARACGVTFSLSTQQALDASERPGFYYWVARTLAAEGQALAAIGCLQQLAISTDPGGLSATLRRLGRDHRKIWRLDEWKPIDDFLGRPYSLQVCERV